jgi:ubiquitin-like protein ATG12
MALAANSSVPSWVTTEPDVAEALAALDNYKKKDPSKGDRRQTLVRRSSLIVKTVVVRFKAVGNAPIMKQNFYKITTSNRFQAVIQFLRKELGWKAGDPLVSRGFAPNDR